MNQEGWETLDREATGEDLVGTDEVMTDSEKKRDLATEDQARVSLGEEKMPDLAVLVRCTKPSVVNVESSARSPLNLQAANQSIAQIVLEAMKVLTLVEVSLQEDKIVLLP